MIGLESPLWLLLLGLIPLIRWLHRFRLQSRILPATTLFLWEKLQRSTSLNGSPGKPDPRWILRAIICTCLIFALSSPFQQTTREPAIDVWLDDSVSMFSLEQNQSRLQIAAQKLHSYLRSHKPSTIQIHSLGDPTSQLSLDPENPTSWHSSLILWASQPGAEPSPPAITSLSSRNRHILITDGADKTLNLWAESAPLAALIQVGEQTQNLTLSHLSLRQSLINPSDISGTVQIDNVGDTAHQARLLIKQQNQLIESLTIEVPAFGSYAATFSILPGKAGLITASLESENDALLLDNLLTLDVDKLQATIRYQSLGNCPAQVKTVIDSHSAFISTEKNAELLINCSGNLGTSAEPTLMIHQAKNITRTMETAHWHTQTPLEFPALPAGLPYHQKTPLLSSSGSPILSADNRQLISKRIGNPDIIDLYIDVSDTRFTRQANFPLLIFALISMLTEHNLEVSPIVQSRDSSASRIAALTISNSSSVHSNKAFTEKFYSIPLLLTALLLLIIDITLGLFSFPGKQP